MKKKLKHLMLLEEYKESPVYRAGKLLQAMLDKIAGWFKTGAFSKQNVTCTYLEKSDTDHGLQNVLSARFHDRNSQYTLTVTAMTEDMLEGAPQKVHMKLKRYDADQAQLLNELDEDIAPSQLTEDYLIGVIADVNKKRDLDRETDETVQEPGSAPEEAPIEGEPASDVAPSDDELAQDDPIQLD